MSGRGFHVAALVAAGLTLAAPVPAATAASPSPSPSAVPTPDCPPAGQDLPLVVKTPVVAAGGHASVTVHAGRRGALVELQGYSQNHAGTASFANDPTPVDRSATADDAGDVTFSDLRLSANTRIRARMGGCPFGQDAHGQVIGVRPVHRWTTERVDPSTVVLRGKTMPRRADGLIVGIYRVQGRPCAADTPARDCSNETLLAQVRADAATGAFTARLHTNRPMTIVIKTNGDAQNVAGRSRVGQT